ncbi:lactate utilization protein B [Pararhodospirillum oryzae]|uniref:Iron-sulfur cluster-binding protein n=1 Tax=Pararhodospirillum oryzae TaxID=478448 RepID=A0A512H5Z6_9PROT|nr:lactate utilization protein B [Pararhodospirillum oryzae]GEO80877.1 iron-sulfur cluster-binding protein [Pararhodospirillum oryzae]
MHPTCLNFPAQARAALENETLRFSLGTMKTGFRRNRATAAGALPEFEALRDAAAAVRAHVLDHLDACLDAFEAKVIAQGGHVHWCRDAAEARETVLALCQAAGARTVTKSKSMIAEEIALNDHLQAHGVRPVETDLGEYIIQLREEPPSHIIAPAIHLRKEHVADSFRAAHAHLPAGRPLDTPPQLLAEARAVLRDAFLNADVGITGANMLIAETGSVVIVTNEGNADLTRLLPATHIVLASIEKVVPTLDDAMTVLRVLARSATGQDMSVYTSLASGPRPADDPDGPSAFHVVLIDNGRSALLGSASRDILRCIRCAACLNHCPVYGVLGGHAYGWVYPGPMGSVLTPALLGLENAPRLPDACTMCGRCAEVCSVRIPLPALLRTAREAAWSRALVPPGKRLALTGWHLAARHPSVYALGARLGARALRELARRPALRALASRLHRDRAPAVLPVPEGDTFRARWAQRLRASPSLHRSPPGGPHA